MQQITRKLIMTLALLLTAATGAWAQTGENIFQYCYDCQRNPAYPKTTASASLEGFKNPYVGYKGSGSDMGNTSAGPWKLEYVGLWSTTDQHGIEDFQVSNYQDTYNCTDVPVFRLYQWNATANEYQHAAYGVVCAYAKVSNAVEHTAFFEAEGGWGCVLTNSSHSSSMDITFDEDLTTGLTTLIAAATSAASGTPVDVDWNKAAKTGTFTMPGGNVTVNVEYFDFATITGNEVTETADVAAKTETPLVTFEGTITGGTLMYAMGTETTYPDLDGSDWSADIPTAENFDGQGGTAYVWYYIKGDDEHSDTDPVLLAVKVLPEPTYTVEFAEGTEDFDKWKASPNADVKKGTEVTVTYTGTKKVIGVKAEKKAAAPASTPLDNTTTAWTAGTFAVPAGGLTYSDAITVSGEVTLVLTDGETLTLNKGISLASGATLTIQGNGTMNVNGTNNSTASTVAGTGTLVLTSGTLNAKGGNGQGVGDESMDTDNRANAGGNAINGNVTVSGGTLTATGGNGGGVGAMSGGSYGAAGGVAISGNVTITDGTVTATGGNGGSIGALGIDEYGGNGGAAIGGDATISGGTWTATDGTHGVNGDGQGGAGGKAVAGTITDNR